MPTSEIHPVFSIRASFLQAENILALVPGAKIKIRLDFATESINKSGTKRTRLPMELSASIGACLSCKVDTSTYDLIKHLLIPEHDVLLTVCPLSWKAENGSGMFFDFIEIEKYAELPEL